MNGRQKAILLFAVLVTAMIFLIYYSMKTAAPSVGATPPLVTTGPSSVPLVPSVPATNPIPAPASVPSPVSTNPPPNPTPIPTATKLLYIDETTGPPDSELMDWVSRASNAIHTSAKVLPSPTAGASQYTVCQSNDLPMRSMIQKGSTCPTGWAVGPTFYGYDNAAAGLIPACYGHAATPTRGKLGIGQPNCGLYGWIHDGLMYLPA